MPRVCWTFALAGALFAATTTLLSGCANSDRADDERIKASDGTLASWNDTAPRRAIVEFVTRTTTPGSPDFVPVDERIAVFDNDGTLWAEQPVYFQFLFALDRVKALAPHHPEWKTTEPFASLLGEGGAKAALGQGEHAIAEILAVTHAGMTSEEFDQTVRDWLHTARHPLSGRPYTEMAYQPMLELLAYLRANDFKTYIVSGGGVEFMRAFADEVYGVPPQQVIGSSGKQRFELRGDTTAFVKLPALDFNNDKDGKPLAIHRVIGRRPIAAFGNSDGDLQMLQYTTMGGPSPLRRLGMIVHHDDAARESAYDRESHIGKLDTALDEAALRSWTVISMKDDWARIYAW